MCKTGTNPRDRFICKTKKILGVVTSQRQISKLTDLIFFPRVYILLSHCNYHNKCNISILTTEKLQLGDTW